MGQNKSFITHAAVMYSNGEVLEGKNYNKIHNLARKFGFSGEHIKGFTNTSGEFVLPQDAAVIASESGQVTRAVAELEPDDLWPGLPIE